MRAILLKGQCFDLRRLDVETLTYESNFIHHDFVQFGKQHSRYKAILPYIILSKQCCEVRFITLPVVNP